MEFTDLMIKIGNKITGITTPKKKPVIDPAVKISAPDDVNKIVMKQDPDQSLAITFPKPVYDFLQANFSTIHQQWMKALIECGNMKASKKPTDINVVREMSTTVQKIAAESKKLKDMEQEDVIPLEEFVSSLIEMTAFDTTPYITNDIDYHAPAFDKTFNKMGSIAKQYETIIQRLLNMKNASG